jgi:hypothetical protein
MLFTYSPGGIYEVQAATFHETALELQPGESLTGKELPTAGDAARCNILCAARLQQVLGSLDLVRSIILSSYGVSGKVGAVHDGLAPE